MYAIEKNIHKSFTDLGFTVLRAGWPDFMIKSPDGDIFFVEAKGSGDLIRKSQQTMLQALGDMGLNVFIVSESRKNNFESKFDWKQVNTSLNDNETLDSALFRIEFEFIKAALDLHNGNIAKTTRYLGISSRSFRYRLEKFRLSKTGL
ncbi:MAG: helix-turn-helix domain-containing protein [Pseudomonadota bacterium]